MGSKISVSVQKRAYRPNETITVSYNMKDIEYTSGSCWIGLIPHNITSDDEIVNDQHDVSYFHVHQKEGQGTLTTSRSGKYLIKCFSNDNGGERLSFDGRDDIVVGNDMACLYVSSNTYKSNEDVTVSYDLSNCYYKSGSCWIGLIPTHISSDNEEINDNHDVDYFHVHQNTGVGKLKTSQTGRYKIKCFANDSGGKYLGCTDREIIIEPKNEKIDVSVEKHSYRPNEGITVSYDMKDIEYTSGSCWIGLIPDNITSNDEVVNDSHDVSYFHVDEKQGKGTLSTCRSGKYLIKCFANDNGGKRLWFNGRNDIVVGNDMAGLYVSGVSLNKHRPNEEVIITYDLSNCYYKSGSCWIGLIPAHITSNKEETNDSHDVDYFHVRQNKGVCKLKTSRAGRYKIKCFANDSGGKYLGCANTEIMIENEDGNL